MELMGLMERNDYAIFYTHMNFCHSASLNKRIQYANGIGLRIVVWRACACADSTAASSVPVAATELLGAV